MTTTPCKYCDQPFPAKKVGPHRQEFCRAECKNAYHRATRMLGQKLADSGVLGLGGIRAWYEAQNAPDASYTANEG